MRYIKTYTSTDLTDCRNPNKMTNTGFYTDTFGTYIRKSYLNCSVYVRDGMRGRVIDAPSNTFLIRLNVHSFFLIYSFPRPQFFLLTILRFSRFTACHALIIIFVAQCHSKKTVSRSFLCGLCIV